MRLSLMGYAETVRHVLSGARAQVRARQNGGAEPVQRRCRQDALPDVPLPDGASFCSYFPLEEVVPLKELHIEVPCECQPVPAAKRTHTAVGDGGHAAAQ